MLTLITWLRWCLSGFYTKTSPSPLSPSILYSLEGILHKAMESYASLLESSVYMHYLEPFRLEDFSFLSFTYQIIYTSVDFWIFIFCFRL